ncbi:hypothetical protein OEZ86_013716 [Tetradesmus obliquus]|nr:hypothetical protein OEZ86_013716 [Tetradesmus obliquus]
MHCTPSLFRSVAECTQPYGPPASGSSVRSLQSYLTNDRCVDSVYKAILARACAEPQSEAVIAKCIALIKQYVTRHTPSAPVLEAIAAACQRLAGLLPPESGLQKSLVYLESSVARLAGSTLACRRAAQQQAQARPGSSSLLRPWLHAAVNGELGRKPGGSVHSSNASEEQLGAAAAAAARAAAGSPAKGSLEAQQQQQQQQQQELDVHDEDEEEALVLHPGVRLVDAEPCLPEWTFQPSALQALWLQPPPGLGGDDQAELDWSLLLPQYSPSLVPLVEGLPGMEVLHMLSSQDIIGAVTDADQETQLRHMREIAELRRSSEQQDHPPGAAAAAAAAAAHDDAEAAGSDDERGSHGLFGGSSSSSSSDGLLPVELAWEAWLQQLLYELLLMLSMVEEPCEEVLMPGDASDASQLAVLQALCSGANCLAALQATLSAAQPGWADPILAAVTQLLDSHELDLQLLAAVLLRLEDLAVGQQVHAAREVLPLQQQQGFGSRQASSNGNTPGDAAGDAAAAAVQQASMPPEVEAAIQVTLQQLGGHLSAQQQQRPGPQGSAGSVVYVMAAEVQGSWKALKTLCWCDDELARRVARHWLQHLLALTLQQSLKGTILLPLPGEGAWGPGAAAAAACAAADAVCWPQAFLLGRALLPQQMAQVLSGASLALLLDLQLSLLLMLMSSCSSEAGSFAEYGLEAVTQQVLSRCPDPRACLLASQFSLEHMMRHAQQHYWAAVRQLLAAAQAADDERLLGNPFLQLVTLLSQQQQQQQQGGNGAASAGTAGGVAGGGGSSSRSPLGLGMGWSSGARM